MKLQGSLKMAINVDFNGACG